LAIWEHPEILSGPPPSQAIGGEAQVKPELGLCVIHQRTVPIEWAVRFRHLQFPPYCYMMNSNQPYDTAREMCTRGVLEKDVEWVFHLDTDTLIPVNAVPVMIEWAKKFDLPIVSGLYWAKKPGIPMPCAWYKTGENKEANRTEFQPLNIKPHLSDPNKQPLVKVDVVGAGCLLVKADVFKKLDESDPKKPYFQWGLGRKDINGFPLPQMSEDFYFCMRAIDELDIHPHVASAIRCEHICSAVKRQDDGEFELLMMKG